MKKVTKYLLGFCFLLCAAGSLSAQEGFVACGGDDFGPGGSVSFSSGQVDDFTTTQSGTHIAEGLQHAYETLIIESVEETTTYSNVNFEVYPNPATDFVILSAQSDNVQNMTSALYDLNGKLIEKHKTNGTEIRISLKDLANAVYFIKVFNNNNEVKTFKIIKN